MFEGTSLYRKEQKFMGCVVHFVGKMEKHMEVGIWKVTFGSGTRLYPALAYRNFIPTNNANLGYELLKYQV